MQRSTLPAFALVALMTACGSTVQVRSSSSDGGTGLGPTGTSADSPSLTTGGDALGSDSLTPADGTGTTGTSVLAGSGSSGGSTTGGATSGSGSTGSTAGGATTGSAAAAGAPSGQGWTSTTAFIGVPTQEDLHAYTATAGVSFDPGSYQANVNSFLKTLNAHGGLLGRKVVPIYYDIKSSDDGQTAAQAACDYFTRDHKVIAVLNGVNIDFDNFRTCMKKARTPVFSLSVQIYDKQRMQEYGPYLFLNGAPTLEPFVKTWVDRLIAQGYFKGWNTTTGGPGTAARKVALLEPNTPYGEKIKRLLTAQLTAKGIKVDKTYAYTDGVANYASDAAAAQLQFTSAGITHVLTIPPASAILFFFMQQAEQQHYRPVYGFSSYDLPLFFEQNAPAAQMVGGKGVGWFPGEDVDTAHAPADTPAIKGCVAELRANGVTYPGDAHRVAFGAAIAFCDAVHLVAGAVTTAKGFSADDLSRGLAALPSDFPLAGNFGGHFSSSSHSLPTKVRDLSFEKSCSCFVYASPAQNL